MIIRYRETDFSKLYLTVLLLILITLNLEVRGQNPITFSGPSGNDTEKGEPTVKDRIFYGGSFALQLGTITYIDFSPVIGYWLLPRLAVATGPSFRYYKYQYDHRTIYGGKTYLEYVLVKDLSKYIPMGSHAGLFFHLEDELLSLDSEEWRNVSYKPRRFGINTVLAGGGLSLPIGKRASLNLIIMWALNKSEDQIYNDPEVRISFVF